MSSQPGNQPQAEPGGAVLIERTAPEPLPESHPALSGGEVDGRSVATAVFGGEDPDGRARIPARARDLTRRVCSSLVGDAELDDLLLIVSELATNAVTHAASRTVSVSVCRWPSACLVRVYDLCPDPPVVHPPVADAEGRRGLCVVRALAEMGWYRLPPGEGKVVWARYPLGQDPVASGI